MGVQAKLKSRYEIRETLGQGGMGVVYKAYDSVIRREVAVKTIRDTPEPAALETFYKECGVLASMAHPNIIEIFDLGEFEENGVNKPYFVMPLLPGTTLEGLIRNSSPRLTVDRTVDMLSQICRGLQAAHERGLVHRDLKPSNIFVMEDDSVKIIDFGVAHIVDARTTMSLKGTLGYMAPEQIEMKPLSALSDIFSLGIVAYEALTLRRPFQGRTQAEMVEAILKHVPPPATDLNPAVNQKISQVIHKSLAKQPWHRFASAKEFSEVLQKATRNETLELFDASRIQPRIQRASRALEQNDLQFASEILGELEAEGHLDPSISTMQRRVQHTLRQNTVVQLIRSARTRFEEQEYPLALQKLQEALQLDPGNAEALSLQKSIESHRTNEKIDDWFRLARQHIENYAFSHARDALQNVIQLRPQDTQAIQLLAEVTRREQDYRKVRQKKQELYQTALQIWQNGEVSSALGKLQEVLELDRRAPDLSASESGTLYQNFYNQVRTEHDAIAHNYAEARRHLAEKSFSSALALCSETLARYPTNALFQALKFDIEEQQRQEFSGQIAEINRRVEMEADLDRRVGILKDAMEKYPGEAYFEPAFRLMRDKRDLVNSIVAKARLHEEQAQYNEALAQWEILKSIYSPYPGLSFEIERVLRRREQQARSTAKARFVEQIDASMGTGDWLAASEALKSAQSEFPGDAELAELEKLVDQGLHKAEDAQKLLLESQELCRTKRLSEALDVISRAHQLDDRNPVIRAVLVNTLVDHAKALLDEDWRSAEPFILHALDLEPTNSQAQSLRTLASDGKRQEFVDRTISQARQSQSAGDLKSAISLVEQGLKSHPNEFRLLQLMSTLNKGFEDSRRRSLEELKHLTRESETLSDSAARELSLERARRITKEYADDAEFQTVASTINQGQFSATATYAAVSGPAIELPLTQQVLSQADIHGSAKETEMLPVVSRTLEAQEHGRLQNAVLPDSLPVQKTSDVTPIPQPQTSKGGRAVYRWGAIAIVLLCVALISAWLLRPRNAVPLPGLTNRLLEIRTTPVGARVFVDQVLRGTSNLGTPLSPGNHDIRIELDGYEPQLSTIQIAEQGALTPLQVELKALAVQDLAPAEPLRSTVVDKETPKPVSRPVSSPQVNRSLALREEVPLKPTSGVLHLKRFPVNSQVVVQSGVETQARPIPGDEVELLEGSYTFTASAAGYGKRSVAATVEAGKSLEVDLSLQPAKQQPEDLKVFFENPQSWFVEGEWLSHRGGNFLLSALPPKSGSYSFTLWRKEKSAQWVVNYRDTKNYILFDLDKKSIGRTVVRNGKKGLTIKVAHRFEKLTVYPIQLSVTNDTVIHKIYDGSGWIVIDELKMSGQDDSLGRFGFFAPGKDQVFVSHLSFKPM